MTDPGRFAQVVATQAALRALTEAIVFDGSGRMLARSGPILHAWSSSRSRESALERARQGEVVLMVTESDDRVRALVRLDRFVDTFLFVGRLVEPRVLSHMEDRTGGRRRLRRAGGQAVQPSDHLHADLRRRGPAAAAGGGLDRPELRDGAGGADRLADRGGGAGAGGDMGARVPEVLPATTRHLSGPSTG